MRVFDQHGQKQINKKCWEFSRFAKKRKEKKERKKRHLKNDIWQEFSGDRKIP
jgi:hypothetical protein